MKNGKPEIDSDGTKYWRLNGKPHRLDGPAVIYINGYKAWYLNGKYHRLDGPAIEFASGTKYWYINDIEYTEEEFNNNMILTNWIWLFK